MIDKYIKQWLDQSIKLATNIDDRYDYECILEALKFLDKNDISTLNYYINCDKDKISFYQKDIITYAKIIHYANKITREKTLNSFENLDKSIDVFIKKRDAIILILDEKNIEKMSFKQNFIKTFDDDKTNFFIKNKAYLSKEEKQIISYFGVERFFDSNFNFQIEKKLKNCFIKQKQDNALIKLNNNKNKKEVLK